MNNVWRRCTEVWKVDFLARFLADLHKDLRTTIIFWISINLIFAGALSVSMLVAILGIKGELRNITQSVIPDHARIAVEDGALRIQNIPDPSLQDFHEDDTGDSAVIIVDTHGDTYDITTLDTYTEGVAFFSDKMYVKMDDKIESIAYQGLPNFGISKEKLLEGIDRYFVATVVAISVVAMIILWPALMIGRSIMALWWAAILLIVARIMHVEIPYRTAYLSVLNFYFVPTLVMIVLIPFAFDVPYLTSAIFLAVFIANIIWMNRNTQSETTSPTRTTDSETAAQPDARHITPSDRD